MTSSQDEAASRAFRPSRKPMVIAVLANVVLFAGLVLWPWVRGQTRAAETRERFATFAACFWGGEEVDDPGLELPPGERERYEAQVLLAPPDWPLRCREPLEEVAPRTPWLLFPRTKAAEEQVRAGVALVREELDALAGSRRAGAGSVPHRPYLAVGRLMATLSALHEAVGARDDMRGEAIALDDATGGLPRPARVPLQAAKDATVRWTADAEGLQGTATDRRGISRVRVGGGGVDARRVPRPGLVRGTVGGQIEDEAPWIVWAMPEERCAAETDRCASHALGLAPYGDEVIRTPEPRWYAGHPVGRIDRTVHVGEDVLILVAVRQGDPSAELRRFPLDPQPTEAGEPGPSQPVAPTALVPLEGWTPGDTVVLVGSGTPLVVWSSRQQDRSTFHALAPGPRTVGSLDGSRPFALGCDADDARWIVLGTELGLRVARLAPTFPDAGATPTVSAPVALGVRDPIAPGDPQDDRARAVCDAEGADVLVLRDGTLSATRCDGAARCGEPMRIATDVHAFDAAREGGTTVVAWAGEGAAAAVRVRRLEGGGVEDDGAPTVPAACWQNGQGLCGAPMLRSGGGRFLLATREGTDMRVIESTDGGATWQAMTGIR